MEIPYRRFYADKPARLRKLEEARANEDIARKTQALRIAAGITQAQLAQLIGTTGSVICRLENAPVWDGMLPMMGVPGVTELAART